MERAGRGGHRVDGRAHPRGDRGDPGTGGELGGIAPAVRGPGGLGDATVPGLEIHRRLKAAFDPAGVLAPGRFWGGI